jgi:hypothetical protein
VHACASGIVCRWYWCNVINGVHSGNIQWRWSVVMHSCSGRFLCNWYRCNECDVVCRWLLPVVYGTDIVHCSRCWILCSGAGRNLIVTVFWRIVQLERCAVFMHSRVAGIVCSWCWFNELDSVCSRILSAELRWVVMHCCVSRILRSECWCNITDSMRNRIHNECGCKYVMRIAESDRRVRCVDQCSSIHSRRCNE